MQIASRRTTPAVLAVAAVIAVALTGCGGESVERTPVTAEMKTTALEQIAADELPDYSAWEMTEIENGIRYVTLSEGDGEVPWFDNEVRVHYRLWLTDGTLIDSTWPDGVPTPFEFQVGDTRRVIAGWHRIIREIHEGGAVLAVIPWELAYGRNGSRGIPGKADLVFYIRLLRVV